MDPSTCENSSVSVDPPCKGYREGGLRMPVTKSTQLLMVSAVRRVVFIRQLQEPERVMPCAASY
jgi:hypothetical protein